MTNQQWRIQILVILLNGLFTAISGSVAFSTAWSWWHWPSPLWILHSVAAIPNTITKDLGEVVIASWFAGTVFAPFLIQFLRYWQANTYRGFMLASMLAGILYVYLTACLAFVLCVPLFMMGKRYVSGSPFGFVVSIIFAMILSVFVAIPMALILYGPPILLGGAVIGLFNGWVVSKSASTGPHATAN